MKTGDLGNTENLFHAKINTFTSCTNPEGTYGVHLLILVSSFRVKLSFSQDLIKIK